MRRRSFSFSYGRARMATAFLPLAGVRVVDVTSSLAGPYCTEILGALGADVVKVEHPERGDEARAWGPAFWEGSSVMFYAANLNKRSLALDIKRGRDVLLRLVDNADVFLQSLRPGTAARLGFGPDELRERNPRLVYCDIGAFGRAGPLRDRPGYDPLVQAFGGLMSVTGEPDRPGVRVGASIIDQGTGMWAALGILAALHAGRRPHGRRVAVRDRGGTAAVPAHRVPRGRRRPRPARVGLPADRSVPGVPRTRRRPHDRGRQRWTVHAPLRGARGTGACRDPRFATNPDRVTHRDELAGVIQERVGGETLSGLLARLEQAGVPAAPVNDVGQVADHEQTAALGLIQPMPEPTIALPLSIDGERVRHQRRPPRLGEHTDEILRDLGYGDAELEALAAEGAIRRVESSA